MIRRLFLIILFFISFELHAQQNILVLGDSISAGYGLQQNQGWVSLLQQRLHSEGYSYKLINASISGETSGGGLRRILQSLKLHVPTIVIIELGANDGLRGLKLSQLKINLSKISELSRKQNAEVVVIGMKLPPNYGPQYTQAFSNVFLEVSQRKKTAFVPFLFQGFENNLDYFQADQIHPNAQAQPLMLNNIWPALLPLLK